MTLSVDIRHRLGAFDLQARFEAENGILALFGHSGAGKSTIVQAIAGLLTPDEGRISLGDRVLFDRSGGLDVPAHRRNVGYVFQDARLFPHLTVRQNLLYGRWFRGADRSAGTGHVIDLLGLGPLLSRRPARLSGGEAQRVAIGRALLSEPQLLLMDEPLASLDDARRAEILPYLERLRDETALPIVYVSHRVSEIARLASHVVMIEAGHVVATGPVGAVLSDAALAPSLGEHGAGALLPGRIARHHRGDALTEIDLGGTPFFATEVGMAVGAPVAVRIEAEDIMIAREKPAAISALNVLPARIASIDATGGPTALVTLEAGAGRLVARITRRSARTMDLEPGGEVFALVKSSRVAPAMMRGDSRAFDAFPQGR